jgi:hypothetical protein
MQYGSHQRGLTGAEVAGKIDLKSRRAYCVSVHDHARCQGAPEHVRGLGIS